jgi:hypothetical protein
MYSYPGPDYPIPKKIIFKNLLARFLKLEGT